MKIEILHYFHNVIFWFDYGCHFCSKEVLYYCLNTITSPYNKITEVNYFAPSHGKCDVDRHFSKLGTWFKDAENQLSWMIIIRL